MRFIKALATVLVKLPFLPVRWLFFVETLFANRLGLFFSCFEDSLFIAAYALVGVEAFEDEFGGGDLLLRAVFLRDGQGTQFIDQALNFFQVFDSLEGGDGIAQLNFAA